MKRSREKKEKIQGEGKTYSSALNNEIRGTRFAGSWHSTRERNGKRKQLNHTRFDPYSFLSKRRDLLGKATGLFRIRICKHTFTTIVRSLVRKSKERGANEKGQRNDLKVYKVYPGEYFVASSRKFLRSYIGIIFVTPRSHLRERTFPYLISQVFPQLKGRDTNFFKFLCRHRRGVD